MTTIIRFDFARFDVPEAVPSRVPPHPLQRALLGMEDAQVSPSATHQRAQVTPLDERLQPCGAAFVGEVERRLPDAMALWHARPARSPYLAVDLPPTEGRQERVILRVTHCESFGLDYVIRGDVMGS